MKTFKGNRSLKEVLTQCKAQGLTIEDRGFKKGADYIGIRGGGAFVLWNTFNGTFFGNTPDGVEFTSSSTKHESEPWFQGLLNFFYK